MLIFSPHEMKYIWYLPKKSKFSFYFILNGNTEITTLIFTWSFLVRFDFCSVFIGYNIGSKRSNGLESYFNEWNARNQHLKKVCWVCLRVGVTCKLALRQVLQWRHYVWCWRHNMVIMFDVDVTTCVALFLTNILHLKPYVKKSQSQIAKKALFCYSSILFYSENINRISH